MQAARDREAQDRRQAAIDLVTQDFGGSLSGVLVGLVASASGMRDSAGDVAGGAQQTRGDMESATLEAEKSSQNLSRVAAAAEKLTASVGEISRQVDQAATATHEAVEQARAADATVRDLSAAASQIGQVVSLINTIAAQTNLLPVYCRNIRVNRYLRHNVVNLPGKYPYNGRDGRKRQGTIGESKGISAGGWRCSAHRVDARLPPPAPPGPCPPTTGWFGPTAIQTAPARSAPPDLRSTSPISRSVSSDPC
jgi:hypothetical protein